VAYSQDGQEQANMGVAIGDFDLDGHTDIVVTHFMRDTPGLYKNDGTGVFEEVSLRTGLGVEIRYICWGTALEDFDNDGWPDIVMATGNIYPEVAARFSAWPYRTPRLFYRNLRNGKFELIDDPGPGMTAPHSSRGSAVGDFDNDGDVDILIMNMNEPPSLLRNDVRGDNTWLKIFLVGTKSNRSAIGARVVAHYGQQKQAKTVTAQSSYYSSNDRRLHFGLGNAPQADVEIFWPNGGVEKHASLPANHLVTIKEGTGVSKLEKWNSESRIKEKSTQ
jgi:hypothetical protein